MSLEKKAVETVEDAGISGFESEETESDLELEQLEFDVKEMAQKILRYRSSLSDQLKSSFVSLLESSRPVVLEGLEPGISGSLNHGDEVQATSHEGTTTYKEDSKNAEKIQLLKDKISNNVATIPMVLKRVKDCISTIDKLDSYNGMIIHPAFKRKKTGSM